MLSVKTPLIELKGVGEALNQRLIAVGLKTVNDLIGYFPRKYSDYSNIVPIADTRPGLVSLKVRLHSLTERRVRRGLHITEAVAEDDSGKLRVIWFNQPYRAKSILPARKYYLSGEFKLQRQRLQVVNPSIELADGHETTQTARIIATYPESGSLNSVLIRKLINQAVPVINNLKETMPADIINRHKLLSYAEALKAIHLPRSDIELSEAKRRLAFEELFVVMMASKQMKNQLVRAKSMPVKFQEQVAKKFVNSLHFNLTDTQRKIVWQIYKDIAETEPMNRLIEGDVGSGKTVIAVMASIMVAESGLQVAFLAPTELLAMQHFDTMKKLLKGYRLKDNIELLTGSKKPKQKSDIKKRLADNKISIVIGTHALLQESVDWHRLGLIVVDEQHRFGVEQRQKLFKKAGHMPHVLCLTATPIPRSLALTVYGELDISVLNESPKIRSGVDTSIISPNSKDQMYEKVIEQLKAGRQAYVVCPLIEESEILQSTSAQKMFDSLKQKQFRDWRVGLLHGRMRSEEKDQVMKAFINHKIDILVSTTVIEVGVDIANATVMIIESADRFGLAQLHQLRGRVGRAEHKGHCYLVLSDSNAPSRRMRAIASTNDGFKLAELDLEIRGPGAIYGTKQHGELDLRIAKLTDTKLIAEVRSAVNDFIAEGSDLLKYKQIAAKVQRASKLTYLN